MENIEQLQQDNAKLTERLNNAAKFFREQKAQIEALTKENEELKTKFKEQESFETNTINKVIPELEEKLKGYENEFKSLNAVNDDLNKQCNEYELKLQAAEEKAEIWQKNLRSVENTTNEEVKKVTIARDEWIEKYRNLEKNIESKDKAYQNLQNTYNEVFADYNKLKEEISQIDKLQNTIKTYERKIDELENNNPEVQKLEEQLVKAEKTIENDKLDYNKLNQEYKVLNDTYNKLNNEYSDIYTKYNDLEQGRIKSEEQLNALNTLCIQSKEENKELKDKIDKQQEKYNITLQELENAKANREEFRSKLVETEEQYDRLNKLYDTCEAEKLSAQADCDQLQEKIKSIEANNINNKEWQDYLENVIEQIRNLADDVINPKPATPENKENIMKRTGDYNVAGQNIGV